MLQINKLGEVGELEAKVVPSKKDHFANPLVQQVQVPGVFFLGDSCQIAHACHQCNQEVKFTVGYGAFVVAKTWSLKRLGGQHELLDQIGNLLNLKQQVPLENGIKIAHYYTAVLDIATVGYYRCPHCEAQYLIGYAQRITDGEGRGLPESNTMHVQCIAQIATDEKALLAKLEFSNATA